MSSKNFSPIGPAVWPAISNIYLDECLVLLYIDLIYFYKV